MKTLNKTQLKTLSPAVLQRRRVNRQRKERRSKVALLIRMLSPLKELLKNSMRQVSPPVTGFNMALKSLSHAVTGTYPDFTMDYAAMQFSRGTVGTPQLVELLAIDGSLMVGWDPTENGRRTCGDDQVLVLVYNPTDNSYLFGPYGVVRADSVTVIPIPENYRGRKLHVYLFCVSRYGLYSDTVYGGAVID